MNIPRARIRSALLLMFLMTLGLSMTAGPCYPDDYDVPKTPYNPPHVTVVPPPTIPPTERPADDTPTTPDPTEVKKTAIPEDQQPTTTTTTRAHTVDQSPRDVSGMLLFAPVSTGAAYDIDYEPPTVEKLLENGWYIAIKGAPEADSIRCQWHGVARTLAQREEQIRFLLGLSDDTDLPSPQETETIFTAYAEAAAPGWDERSKAWMIPLARGELSTGYLVLSCYADYAVSEYILGEGPSTVTIAFEQTQHDYSYDIYLKAGESRGIPMEDAPSRSKFTQDILDPSVKDAQAELNGIIMGRENILFLIPMGVHDNVAIEAWQSVAQ